MTSGAIYYNEPTKVLAIESREFKVLELPKSAILRIPSLETRILSGLISR